MSYRELFLQKTGLDILLATNDELFDFLSQKEVSSYPSLKEEGRDALLNLILGAYIEPQLGKEEFLVLAYYPASQAALAQKRWSGEECVAERFEVYYQGIELANGYHELADAVEQRERFYEANQMRLALGKESLPIDERFLKALELGLPDCCGVAVGFDRLMMLRQGQSEIKDVLSWGWALA